MMIYKAICYITAACFVLQLASCADQDAFHTCRKMIEDSVTNLSKAKNMEEILQIDAELNDTLNKYGHSRMTHEMIKEIKGMHELYLKTKRDVCKKINGDSILHKRVINVPNVGEVEFKAPPEV